MARLFPFWPWSPAAEQDPEDPGRGPEAEEEEPQLRRNASEPSFRRTLEDLDSSDSEHSTASDYSSSSSGSRRYLCNRSESGLSSLSRAPSVDSLASAPAASFEGAPVFKARPPPGPASAAPGRRQLYEIPQRGKGTGKGPPLPPKGAGKGPVSKAVRSSVPALPIGRRLSLKPSRGEAEAFWRANTARGEDDGRARALASARRRLGAVGAARDAPTTELQLDLAELHGAFAPKPVKVVKPKKSQARRKELLPRGVAQNIAIALARLGASGATDLVEALRALSGDTDEAPVLSAAVSDGAARLLDVWPEEKVLTPLLEFAAKGGGGSEEKEPLRDVEKQLLPMVAIPRVRQRLKLLVLAGTASKRVEEATALLERVRHAVFEVQNSALLRELLAIIVLLFNYVNFGSAPPGEEDTPKRAPLRGVDVPSLLRLRETKAFQGDFAGFNMLHFVLKQLLRQQATWKKEKLDEELSSLKHAARVHLDHLSRELEELQGDFLFAQSELREHRKEYTGLPDSDDEAERHPKQPSNWGFLERLLARGLDLASLAEAWLRGEEVVGRPYHPEVGVFRAFEPRSGEGAPPPGWLWLCRPSGRWQRCWSEIRGPILILYKVDLHSCTGAIYAALPGAVVSKPPEVREAAGPEDSLSLKLEEDGLRESAPSEGSTAATETGKLPYVTCESPHRSSAALCFEVITAGESGRLLRLSAATKREVQSWRKLLEGIAGEPGGYLTVSQVAGGRNGRSWSPQTLFCAAADGELAAFHKPRDALEASPPAMSWKLTDFAACRVGFGSFELRRHMGDLEFGEPETWSFACQDVSDAPRWVELLSQPPASVPAEDAKEEDPGKGLVPRFSAKVLREAQSDSQPGSQPGLLRMDTACLEQAFGPAAGRQEGAEQLRKALGREAGDSGASGQEGDELRKAPGREAREVGSNMIFSESEEETTSSCETEDAPSPSSPVEKVVTLPQLEISLARQVCRFDQALQATEADCRELQRYFGVDVAQEGSRRELNTNASRLLESLSDFVVQIRGAWEDLEKHAQSQSKPGRNSLKTSRKTLRSLSSTQPSVQQPRTLRERAFVPQDPDLLREGQRVSIFGRR